MRGLVVAAVALVSVVALGAPASANVLTLACENNHAISTKTGQPYDAWQRVRVDLANSVVIVPPGDLTGGGGPYRAEISDDVIQWSIVDPNGWVWEMRIDRVTGALKAKTENAPTEFRGWSDAWNCRPAQRQF